MKKVLFILGWLLTGIVWAQPTPTVAAAADLKFALEEIAKNYKSERGKDIKLVFGSSGLLWQQIKNGAPFGLYMSADEAYVSDLAKKGLTLDGGSLYAIGRIVLLQKKGSPVSLGTHREALLKAIKAAKRIAIANPDHAPYGRAAKEYFTKMGLWNEIQPKLIFGENISQTTMYALTGNADFAVSALSLARAPNIQSQSSHVLISDADHQPLRQRMVLLKNSSPSARDFYIYLQEPSSKTILSRYGFVIPNN